MGFTNHKFQNPSISSLNLQWQSEGENHLETKPYISFNSFQSAVTNRNSVAYIHMERPTVLCRRAHTTTHPHPNGLPGKGAQIILSGLPVVQSPYMGQSGVDVWVCVEDGEGLRGNLPTSDGRPNDNKCQILVQTRNGRLVFFLRDIISSPPPQNTTTEKKIWELQTKLAFLAIMKQTAQRKLA